MKTHTKLVLKNILSAILTMLIMIASFFSIIGVIFNIVYTPAPIISYSMCPTLNNDAPDATTVGDYAYMNNFASYKNNDIVIAEVSWNNDAIIKRLVGTPGDTIQIKDETTHYGLYVNENLLYTKEKTDRGYKTNEANKGSIEYYSYYIKLLESDRVSTTTASNGEKCILLNEGEYFLMGDNWGESKDCITQGTITKAEILGKVDFVIKMNENKFFAMLKQMILTAFRFN